ncbi:hypothetical protein QYE76_056983 [Lolium multiflorum]|uniref:CCHC-type domain-containing protein n=1 Tax=Lolium multiflorum TaxID=4521 RepID=A0AAD8T397_LOLMU|nr:hypothetical protein QYE76_056983 [Lolium multiflorum]
MENYSSSMGAAVMKMAVEMAAVSMEKPSGHFPSRRREMNHIATVAQSLDGELLLLMGAAAVMKMAVEMAACRWRSLPGHFPLGGVPEQRLLSQDLGFAMAAATEEEIKELEAQVLSLKKDLEKRHEGKSTLDKMLSVQKSPNDKSGLGFNSNNKNKSKSKNNKKKGQDKVKDPAKLVCFKCKVEGHHVRSCPLKKKHLSEKQQGKRPQGQGQAHARPQVEDRALPKKNQDIVPKRRNQ